jgi:hypothetical protein
VMAHAHDRTQPVRLGAKIAALSRGQGKHRSSVAGGSASLISRLAITSLACRHAGWWRISPETAVLSRQGGNRR